MNRGTNAVEPVPTSRVWMAVEEKAVARATMFTTAPVTSSCSCCALSARMARLLLPNLAALSSSGTWSPTPITNVTTSWMPVSEGLRSLVARKLLTSSSSAGDPLYWSVPQPAQVIVLSRNACGRLLSPKGSPSVMSTTALAWQEAQSGLLAPVGAVNAALVHLAPNFVVQKVLSPAKNWQTLKRVSASGVAIAS